MRYRGRHASQRQGVEVVPSTDGFVPDRRQGSRKYPLTELGLSPMIGIGIADPLARRFVGGLSLRQFLGITGLFWVYVTLTNILYAYSMRAGLARMTSFPLFATWDARLLQHLMLLPVLLVSYWASLKIQ